jgi:acetyl esterase/lipase
VKRTISTVHTDWISRKRLDVRYSDVSPNHVLDVYLPDSETGPFPVIVFVHGGGFLGGSKNYGALAPILGSVSQGYALISVEYRLSMEATWPAGVHDVKCALRFITAHADDLGIDPDRIVLWGNSAGGAIVNTVVATLTSGRVDDLSLGHRDARPRVAALVSWFAVLDWVSLAYHHDIPTDKTFLVTSPTIADARRYAAQGWKRVEDAELGFAIEDDLPRAFAASPIRLVQDEFVPALFQHGTADVIVPFADSAKMVQTINTRVRPGLATLRPMRGEIHGGPGFYTPDNIVGNLRWIDEHIGRTHDYTPLPDVGRTGIPVDDGVTLPADQLAEADGVSTIPTRTIDAVKDTLEFWGPAPPSAQAPQGV